MTATTADNLGHNKANPSLNLSQEEKNKYLNFMHKELNRKIYSHLKKSELSDSLQANVERPLLAPENNFQVARGPILPESLKKVLNNDTKKSSVGFLSYIGYAYFIQGAQIFLWDLTLGKHHYLENPGGDIQAASLVKPVEGVFPSEVQYILVLASKTYVHLFGLSLNSENVEIYQLNYYAEIPSQEISCITGSENGRIFLGTLRGDILEFRYQKESSFLWDKCSIINHSKSSFFIVPTLMNMFSSENSIISLTIDESRKAFYALKQDSSIQIYNLGKDGKEFGFIGKLEQYRHLVQKALNLSSDSLVSATVAIHAVEADESNLLRLVAVTAAGITILFKTTKSTNLDLATGLEFATAFPSTHEALCRNGFVGHTSFYKRGCFLLAAPYQENSSSVSINFFEKAPGQIRDKNLLLCSTLKSDGCFFDTTELVVPAFPFCSQKRILPFLIGFDDLCSQYYASYRKFCILGTQGSLFFYKLRPIDQLYKIITSQDSQGQQIKQFLERYGASETCCMLLAFLSKYPLAYTYANTSTPSSFSSPKFCLSDAFLEKCLHFYKDISGHPSFGQNSKGYTYDKNLIQPLINQPFNFSNALYGLLLFTSRILCPVWNSRLFNTSTKTNVVSWEITLNDDLLKLLCDTLHNLLSVLDQIQAFQNQSTGFNSQSNSNTSDSLKALESEKEALGQIKEIIRLSSQVSGFIRILHEGKITDHLKSLKPEIINQLKTVSFEYLLASPSRHTVINELVKLLINSHSVDGKKSYISDTLLSNCKDLYESGNLPMIKGFELIREAECQFTINEITLKLKRASECFSGTKSPIPVDQLTDILKKYCQLGFQIGALILISNNVAKLKPEEIKSFSSDVSNYYQTVELPLDSLLPHLKSVTISGLDSKIASEILPNLKLLMFSVNDENFHNSVYTWFLKNKLYIILYNICSPYFETYVSKNCTADKTDLLYSYYCTTGKYLKAAKLMFTLATSSESKKMPLEKKIELLSKALIHSEKPIADEDLSNYIQMKNNIKTICETANIQLLILKEYMSINEDQVDESVVTELNSKLFNIEKLYSQFVIPLQLTRSKQTMLSKGYVSLTGVF